MSSIAAFNIDDIAAGLAEGARRIERARPPANPEREARVADTTANVWAFRRTYLAHLFRVRSADYHFADDEEIERVEMFAAGDPRFHAKTTRHTLSRALWESVTGRCKYIIIIRDDVQHVEESILSLRRELEDNALLVADYGDQSEGSVPWTKTQLVLANGCKILGLTKGQPIPGAVWAGVRVERIYIDDPQTIDDVQSAAQRERDKVWLDNDVLPAQAHGGKLIMCQNRIHEDCLIEHLRKKPLCSSRVYDAIVSEPKRRDLWDKLEAILSDAERPLDEREKRADAFYRKNETEMLKGVKLLWPEMWTYLGLMRMKLKLGSIVFWTQFRNRPFTGDRAKWLTWIEPGRLGKIKIESVVEGFDLACSMKTTADKTARVQVSVDSLGRCIVTGAFADRMTFSQQLEMVTERPAPRLVARVIETNQYQAVLADAGREASIAGGATIVAHHTRLAPELRIVKILRLLESGKLVFVEGNRVVAQLAQELISYRAGHLPDLVSALELAIDYLCEHGGNQAAFVLLGDVMP